MDHALLEQIDSSLKIPMGRIGTPEDASRMIIVFLASHQARCDHGTENATWVAVARCETSQNAGPVLGGISRSVHIAVEHEFPTAVILLSFARRLVPEKSSKLSRKRGG